MQETFQKNAANVLSSRKTILIVENDLERGYTLAQILKEETPDRVVFATDAFQALQILHAVLPDVILLASHLLTRGGLTLIDYLRASSREKHPFIVLMSAWRPHSEIKAQHLRCVEKPGAGDVFVRLVKELLM
jgi:CheY-like chemotaxis protein